MKKLVFFLVGVCLAAGSAILIISPTSTEACGYSMPVTLLELYKKSDAIYIGRFTGTESGELISEDERHSYTELNKYFDISYTLKGAPAKTFTQVGADYASKDQNKGYETLEEVEAASVIPDIHLEEEDEDDLKLGEVVLLFVRVGDEGERSELTDYRDGMKRLPAEDLRVYEDRIKELNTIFAADKPDPEKITDWLVRCAEERATRWEGAFELRLSFAALDTQNRRDAKRKAEQIRGTTEDDENDDDDDDDDDDESQNEDPASTRKHYAEFLNEYHKQTLSSVLLNSEFQTVPQPTDRAVLVHGDRELISLISRWADTRLTELFLGRLRGGAYTSPENTELMETISSILNDQLLADVAEKHSNVDHHDDDDAVEESDLEDDAEESSEEDGSVEVAPEASDTVAGSDADATEENDNAIVDENSADEPETCEGDKKPVITYKQFRQNLLDKFLARAEMLISDPTKRVAKDE